MEDVHRTHKEPAWGWIGVVLEGFASRPRPTLRPTPQPAHRIKSTKRIVGPA